MVKDFRGLIHILHIKVGYQPFVHTEQSVKIFEINKIDIDDNEKFLRTGDKTKVKLQFIMKPEYIKEGMKYYVH